MKITKIESWPIELVIQDLPTNGENGAEKVLNVIARVETNKGISGYGCAALDVKETKESAHSVQMTIEGIIASIAQGLDPLRISEIMEQLKSYLSDQPCAMAAFDMALNDILGKYAILPLWKLLGGYRQQIKTSVTIET